MLLSYSSRIPGEASVKSFYASHEDAPLPQALPPPTSAKPIPQLPKKEVSRLRST